MELTRTRIRIQHRDSSLASPVLEKPLLRTVVARARQTRQVDEHGHLVQRVQRRQRRQVEVECHFALRGLGVVGELQQLAAEGSDGGCCADGHFGWLIRGMGMGKGKGKMIVGE